MIQHAQYQIEYANGELQRFTRLLDSIMQSTALTRAELAQRLRCSERTIDGYYEGMFPTAGILKRIMKEFGYNAPGYFSDCTTFLSVGTTVPVAPGNLFIKRLKNLLLIGGKKVRGENTPMSKVEFARRIGCSPKTVHDWFKGVAPSSYNLDRIAEIFGGKADDLRKMVPSSKKGRTGYRKARVPVLSS